MYVSNPTNGYLVLLPTWRRGAGWCRGLEWCVGTYDLQEFVLSTKMVDTSPVRCDEVIGEIAGKKGVALRSQAAAAEEASLHHAL